jgi:predicted O-linked N-acetylglucosamine transferase (SPINDLY family)
MKYPSASNDHQKLLDTKKTYLELLNMGIVKPEILNNLALIELQMGNDLLGLKLLEKSLKLDSNQPDIFRNLGIYYHMAEDFVNAVDSYDKAISLNSQTAFLYYEKATIQIDMQYFKEAVENFDKAIQLDSSYLDAYNGKAVALMELKLYEKALLCFDSLIKLKSDVAEFYANRGEVLLRMHRHNEALQDYVYAIQIKPRYEEAYFKCGVIYSILERYEDALESYKGALQLNSNYIEALFNRGNVYSILKRYDDALESYNDALQINSDLVEAHFNRGHVFDLLRRFEESLESYDHAIKLRPDYAEAHFNRGHVFDLLRLYDEALENYDRAIKLRPDYAEAHTNRGAILDRLKRHDEALESYDCAIHFKPNIDYLLGNVLHCKMQLCDWVNYDQYSSKLVGEVKDKNKGAAPFVLLSLTDDGDVQKKSAEVFITDKYSLGISLPKISKHLKHQKIRIGYFSEDFHEHPVSYLLAELFELHDRNQFELFGFSLGVNSQDALRKRIEIAFDHFLDVAGESDEKIALIAREMEIDIAVDLGGLTGGMRTKIFANRAAPIQVNYLGYAGTMGADFIDYIIGDEFLIPRESQRHFSEKIVYLPGTYMVNDSTLKLSQELLSRKSLGLPEDAFIFCCFNAPYKITPSTFFSWMRILKSVNNSVLWLSKMNDTAANNLKSTAAGCGVDADRIIFASRTISVNEHLKRIQLADLFLDTFPYNAHTTANDALRVGLPLLTLIGDSFASRVAGSLLVSVNLPELIKKSQDDYEALAIELAKNPDKLRLIRNKLASNLPGADFLNTARYTRQLESAFIEMFERYQQNLPLDHIYINAK